MFLSVSHIPRCLYKTALERGELSLGLFRVTLERWVSHRPPIAALHILQTWHLEPMVPKIIGMRSVCAGREGRSLGVAARHHKLARENRLSQKLIKFQVPQG